MQGRPRSLLHAHDRRQAGEQAGREDDEPAEQDFHAQAAKKTPPRGCACLGAGERRGGAETVAAREQEQGGEERHLEQRHPAIGRGEQAVPAADQGEALHQGGDGEQQHGGLAERREGAAEGGKRRGRRASGSEIERGQAAQPGAGRQDMDKVGGDEAGRAHAEGMAMGSLQAERERRGDEDGPFERAAPRQARGENAHGEDEGEGGQLRDHPMAELGLAEHGAGGGDRLAKAVGAGEIAAQEDKPERKPERREGREAALKPQQGEAQRLGRGRLHPREAPRQNGKAQQAGAEHQGKRAVADPPHEHEADAAAIGKIEGRHRHARALRYCASRKL